MALRIDPSQLRVIPIDQGQETFGVPICPLGQPDRTTWCWAACVQMILVSYAIMADRRPCAIASNGSLLHQPRPGSDSGPVCCNGGFANCRKLTLSEGEITNLWSKYGVSVNPTLLQTPQDSDELSKTLRNFLCRKHPVELGYLGLIKHVIMLYGWSGDVDTHDLTFYHHDPANSSNTKVLAETIGNHPFEGQLIAFWEIMPAANADPTCNPTIKSPGLGCEKNINLKADDAERVGERIYP